MKAKHLKNNEIVYIKQISDKYNDYGEKFYVQLNYFLEKFKKLNCKCNIKDIFSANDCFYLVLDIYDDYLSNYLEKIKPNGLPPNLIKKILSQLNESFKNILGEFGKRNISPSNILIKYTNEKKDNFDVCLNEEGICGIFNDDFFSSFYYHPNFCKGGFYYLKDFAGLDSKIKKEYELFNIGMNLMNFILINFHFFKNQIIKYIRTLI